MKYGRVIGIDDGYFKRGLHIKAPLIGVVMKGNIVDEVRITSITVDGNDIDEAVERILQDFRGVALFYNTIFGGSMVISIRRVYEDLSIPSVVILSRKPSNRVLNTIKGRNPHYLSRINEYHFKEVDGLYLDFVGLSMGDVKHILEKYRIASRIPEPLRLAHLIGRGFRGWDWKR